MAKRKIITQDSILNASTLYTNEIAEEKTLSNLKTSIGRAVERIRYKFSDGQGPAPRKTPVEQVVEASKDVVYTDFNKKRCITRMRAYDDIIESLQAHAKSTFTTPANIANLSDAANFFTSAGDKYRLYTLAQRMKKQEVDLFRTLSELEQNPITHDAMRAISHANRVMTGHYRRNPQESVKLFTIKPGEGIESIKTRIQTEEALEVVVAARIVEAELAGEAITEEFRKDAVIHAKWDLNMPITPDEEAWMREYHKDITHKHYASDIVEIERTQAQEHNGEISM